VPGLDRGRERTKQGYFWAMARDDRPWGGREPPAVVYRYVPGRGHIHANTLLGEYRGILQCDGYQAQQETRWARVDRDFRNADFLLAPRALGPQRLTIHGARDGHLMGD
jgi:hypothetical protein